jgi:hypothetical protein
MSVSVCVCVVIEREYAQGALLFLQARFRVLG